jgi:hypothetical protein
MRTLLIPAELGRQLKFVNGAGYLPETLREDELSIVDTAIVEIATEFRRDEVNQEFCVESPNLVVKLIAEMGLDLLNQDGLLLRRELEHHVPFFLSGKGNS